MFSYYFSIAGSITNYYGANKIQKNECSKKKMKELFIGRFGLFNRHFAS